MNQSDAARPAAVLINGTVGVGKTTVAERVGGLLTDASVPNAVIDVDWLRRAWPSQPGDRFNGAMALRNLRDVARNYLDGGAIRLAIAGVVETPEERLRYQDAIGIPLRACRLRVKLPIIKSRLARRHDGEPAALRWYLDRAGELDTILDEAGVDDFSVDATSLSIDEIAGSVLHTLAWS